MAVSLMDVWNIETFDGNLLAELKANETLVRKYIVTDREIFLEREAAALKAAYRTNPYAETYYRFLEDLGRDMETRTIRAWHYTRLTDAEVEQLRTIGIALSSLDATRRRLEAQVAAGVISDEIANALFAASPFQHSEQVGPRSDKFWLTSHPVEIGDSGVNPASRQLGRRGGVFLAE
jgi:hypothetical protein